jgi:type VI secretion system secreted protein VgrG
MPHSDVVRLEIKNASTHGWEIVRLEGREAISTLFDFDIEVRVPADETVDLEALLGEEITLSFFERGQVVREVHGMIEQAADALLGIRNHASFRLHVVPLAYKLALVQAPDIQMDVSVPDLFARKLELVGLGDTHVARLSRSYPELEFVIQYNETDLSLLSRMTEHVGVSFTLQDDGGVLLTDHNSGFPRIEEPMRYQAGAESPELVSFSAVRTLAPSFFVVRDYNYRTPQVDVTGTHEIAASPGGIVEYGAHVKTPEQATELAKIRGEERFAATHVHRGVASVPRLGAGRVIDLKEIPKLGDVEVLITKVEHTLSEGASRDGELHYEARFEAVLASIPFRPTRRTPKPMIAGLLTAVVDDGKTGRDDVAHLDESGRYRIRFLFDMTAEGERAPSRPIRMAQPHAGPSYGMHFPLKPGIEVLVGFVNGDPDRPVIVGAVPNAVTPSPVDAGAHTLNRIKTESGVIIELGDRRLS